MEEYVRDPNSNDSTFKSDSTKTLAEPVLSHSVENAVDGYFDTMDDQPVTDLYELVLCQVEMPLLVCVLRQTGNNQSHAAQVLGLNRGTLRKKLKKYGLL